MFIEAQTATINQLKDALGNSVKTVDEWAGGWTEAMIRRLGTQTPAVYVHFANARNLDDTRWKYTFSVFVAAQSSSADKGTIGADEISGLCVTSLQTTGVVTDVDTIFNAKMDDLALFVVELQYTVVFNQPTDGDDLSQFAQLNTDYTTDNDPNAQDQIDLPQETRNGSN